MEATQATRMNIKLMCAAREIYASGGNVSDFLKKELGQKANSKEIIEFAYDLQAGSYVEYVSNNTKRTNLYAEEMASLLFPHMDGMDSVLDVGAGEMTTLSLLLRNLGFIPAQMFAFDISWSRISRGRTFMTSALGADSKDIKTFVSDIASIPLPSSSVDLVVSSHALEPNGADLESLIIELFRVCRKKLILFEPSYEMNSPEGKERMTSLGYIKDLPGAVRRNGGKMLKMVPVINIARRENPTYCHVIEPPLAERKNKFDVRPQYTVPGTEYTLAMADGFWHSEDVGLAFPVLQGIPVLRNEKAFWASDLR